MLPKFHPLSANPTILGGKPCVSGTRISVDLVIEWFASGANKEEIIKTHPLLSEEAINEALLYASGFLRNDINIDVK
ncbi:MAG: DUF433 domain-containing protein [Bacteroidia bacterium]|nr:DUF433 domain-containing protein [Bacteroidia bacterium]